MAPIDVQRKAVSRSKPTTPDIEEDLPTRNVDLDEPMPVVEAALEVHHERGV